ncbi:MAG: circadian clock protein KaiB [Gammaproteobacteria bacterium]|nr:circadian clock protein KaiB [Gammaproteobacteria bacterium]
MRRKKTLAKSLGSRLTAALVMRLYVANSAPNSLLAIANLQIICDEFLQDNFKLEIVDVLEEPLRALADGILVTPSLAKLAPSPIAKIVGNLSDKSSVMRALGIRG